MKRLTACGLVALMLITPWISVFAQGADASADRAVTRAELVGRIADYFAWPHPSEYNDYWKTPLKKINDVSSSDPWGKQIETAYEEGIIGLDAAGNFHPDRDISRQDAAVIFANAFHIAPTGQAVMFSDNAVIAPYARASVNALADLGYMAGKTLFLFMPLDALTQAEADAVFERITASMVAPVQALPKTNRF